MPLTLQSALNLLLLTSALLKGEMTPIDSTHSFLLLFSINSSVNYFLLLQQLFLCQAYKHLGQFRLSLGKLLPQEEKKSEIAKCFIPR